MGNTIKTHSFTAILLLIITALIMHYLIYPGKTEAEKEISQKYSQAAEAYENSQDGKVIQIEKEIADLQKENIWIKFIYWIVLSYACITITGLFATWLQYIYTEISFTKKKFKGEDNYLDEGERKASMTVLASALITSGIIVITALVLVLDS